MNSAQQFDTFQGMVSVLARETPHALICDWWRRLDRAMHYYMVAYHGPKRQTSAKVIEVLAADTRIGPEVAAQLHQLRRIRNLIEHGPTRPITPRQASSYACRALDLIDHIGRTVPNELALESGAARVV
jgi:hypothetical protein